MNNRLLILDDDSEFTAFAGAVGKASGYEVMEITDPTNFESTLKSWFPSHVMVDLYMPTIDGLEALRILGRAQSAAKVVLCSGTTRDFLEAANRLGTRLSLNMSGIIEKPPGVTELKFILESLKGDSLHPVSVRHSFDKRAFDETCDTMGREWVHRGVTMLLSQIEITFADAILASPDRELLPRSAHVLASYAEIFGFPEFSRLCRELEETCNEGGDISSPLHKAHLASRSAYVKAREMIAGLID